MCVVACWFLSALAAAFLSQVTNVATMRSLCTSLLRGIQGWSLLRRGTPMLRVRHLVSSDNIGRNIFVTHPRPSALPLVSRCFLLPFRCSTSLCCRNGTGGELHSASGTDCLTVDYLKTTDLTFHEVQKMADERQAEWEIHRGGVVLEYAVQCTVDGVAAACACSLH